MFKNLYQRDEKDGLKLIFKNPYTDPSLDEVERKFLKRVLFLFNKYRFRENDNKHFKDENDPDIPKYIEEHPDYLNVPLERSSKSSRR